jgi:small GTP-binding protein
MSFLRSLAVLTAVVPLHVAFAFFFGHGLATHAFTCGVRRPPALGAAPCGSWGGGTGAAGTDGSGIVNGRRDGRDVGPVRLDHISATSASSRTSTTASRRWPTGCWSGRARCAARDGRSRCSTRWTSSGSAASPSSCTRCACSTVRADGRDYQLNLIDTPGHVDFTYEVSRSLAACEGAILVVDASQGVQAQTLSNLFLALDAGLEIIPVLNKIDLPGAEPERRARSWWSCSASIRTRILSVSAKEGVGIRSCWSGRGAGAAAEGDPDAPLRALIFDSYYDRTRAACRWCAWSTA